MSIFSRDLKCSFAMPQSLFNLGILIPAFNMFLGRSSFVISGIDSTKFSLKSIGAVKRAKRAKVVGCKGIKLPNCEVMKEVEKEGYTYVGTVELDKIKENEMKEKTIKEYKQRLKLVLKSKLDGKNKITSINAWAVAVFRHGAGILQWKESELRDVDRKSRKTMTMYGALHPKSDVDRLYIKRKDRGRGLMSVEQCVREEKNSLGFYVANTYENLIKGIAAAETINTEDTVKSGELKNRKHKNLNKTGMKRKCMGNSPGK